MLRSGITGHNNNSILKVYLSSLCVSDMTVIQNLQKYIKHIRMCLFDLIKQYYGIGISSDLFR